MTILLTIIEMFIVTKTAQDPNARAIFCVNKTQIKQQGKFSEGPLPHYIWQLNLPKEIVNDTTSF